MLVSGFAFPVSGDPAPIKVEAPGFSPATERGEIGGFSPGPEGPMVKTITFAGLKALCFHRVPAGHLVSGLSFLVSGNRKPAN